MDTFSNFYPGKHEFDTFVASIPKDEGKLTYKDGFSLALKAVETFNKGIPHKDRPICLYYFYHFLELGLVNTDDPEILSQFDSLTDFAVSSLSETNILEYLKLLDSKKLYEVCQIRGEIKKYNIGLVKYVSGEINTDWDILSKEAESFLSSEPCIPQKFLETYFLVTNEYCYRTKTQIPKRYELADKVWDTSTESYILKRAWYTLNDTSIIRAYKKHALPPKELKKLLKLEQIEQEVLAEFGENWRGRTAIGKALQLLTKEGREQRKALSEIRDEWFSNIKHYCGISFLDNDPYIKGYVAYLNAHVYAGTEDWKGAVKELKSALEDKFDPKDVLLMLVLLLDGLKKYDESADYAQKLLDISSIVENEKEQDFIQPVILILKQVGRKPLWANRIWEEKAKVNIQKLSSIIASLEPQIESTKKSNIEQRTNETIKLLDRIIPLEKADDALNNNQPFSELNVTVPTNEILELSIEEIEPFIKAGIDKLKLLFNTTISLEDLLNYNEAVIEQIYENIVEKFNSVLTNFPNTLACIPIAKRQISAFLSSNRQEIAVLLADHLISKRSKKVERLYDAIKIIQQTYHKNQQWEQEIELLTKLRKLLNEREYKQATSDLIDAFVQLLSKEKSLNKKKRMLKLAELEHLDDDRLIKIRMEVNSLLNKRKKLLIKLGIIGGGLVLIFIIYVLFLK